MLVGDIFWQELERDATMQAGILGLVDHTHPTATQFLDNPVVREGLTTSWGEVAI